MALNTAATRKEAQEYLIDLILNFIVTNAANASGDSIDFNNYRRYINQTTGQITVGTPPDNSNFVLYEKDYRENFSADLLKVVDDIITNCGQEDSVEPDIWDLTYFANTLEWNYIEGGNDCSPTGTTVDTFADTTTNTFGGISFSGPQGAGGDDIIYIPSGGGGGCVETFGFMSCNNIEEDKKLSLALNNDILASLSQYIKILQQQTNINENLAEDILDTNIYELLPGGQTRQEQITKFFQDYENLKGPKPGEDELPGFVDEDNDGQVDGWNPESPTDESTYTTAHDISDDGQTGNISRLDGDAPTGFETQTLQSLRDDLNEFLYDIDYDPITTPADTRPDYQNQSGGYLKFRGLNQAIIIRSTEKTDVGLKNYRVDGFTITMWVRFLDRVSSGTLFNYGNPLRDDNPTGFMLETLIDTEIDLNNRYIRLVLRDGLGSQLRDSHVGSASGRHNTATNNSLSSDITTYTPVPIDFSEWFFIVASYNPNVKEDDSFTYYMDAGDLAPDGTTPLSNSPEFWRNNIIPSSVTHVCSNPTYTDETSCLEAGMCNPPAGCLDEAPTFGSITNQEVCESTTCAELAEYGIWTPENYTWDTTVDSGTGTYTASSNYGAMCKVEVISKSDLLRARGFDVQV